MRVRLFSLLLFLALAATMSCDDGSIGDPPGSPDASTSCSDDECPLGHACRPRDDASSWLVCSSECIPSICEALSKQCSSPQGTCIGRRCPEQACDGDEICDESIGACFAVTGFCTIEQPCPQFGGPWDSHGRASCIDATCRVVPNAPTVPLGLEPRHEEPLVVEHPWNGEVFSSESDVAFAWLGGDDATLLLVFEAPPHSNEELSAAFWGAWTDAVRVIRWDAGSALSGGLEVGPAPPPPRDRPLFGLVLRYARGHLDRVSRPFTFRVGSAWPAPGAACGDEGAAQGQCFHPSHVQVCDGGLCRRFCGSDVDCEAGVHCLDPVESRRFCER